MPNPQVGVSFYYFYANIVLIFYALLIATRRHLTQLARKGGNPFDFKFVEHHKV